MVLTILSGMLEGNECTRKQRKQSGVKGGGKLGWAVGKMAMLKWAGGEGLIEKSAKT